MSTVARSTWVQSWATEALARGMGSKSRGRLGPFLGCELFLP